MISAVVHYRLSEKGRKQALKEGKPAQEKQCLEGMIEDKDLDLFSVKEDGTPVLELGNRRDQKWDQPGSEYTQLELGNDGDMSDSELAQIGRLHMGVEFPKPYRIKPSFEGRCVNFDKPFADIQEAVKWEKNRIEKIKEQHAQLLKKKEENDEIRERLLPEIKQIKERIEAEEKAQREKSLALEAEKKRKNKEKMDAWIDRSGSDLVKKRRTHGFDYEALARSEYVNNVLESNGIPTGYPYGQIKDEWVLDRGKPSLQDLNALEKAGKAFKDDEHARIREITVAMLEPYLDSYNYLDEERAYPKHGQPVIDLTVNIWGGQVYRYIPVQDIEEDA